MPIYQLDTENADRDLTSIITVLTDTPHATEHVWCQAYVQLGDGTKNLDGTGGNFLYTISIGGNTIQPTPTTVVFAAGTVRGSFWTTPFPVPANKAVIIQVDSPNAADTDVDTTAYLFEVAPGVYGTDNKALISADAQDLSTTLDVNAKAIGGTAQTGNDIGADINDIKAKTDNLPSSVPKNVALSNFAFAMYSSIDHVTPLPGLTILGYISKDGAAFASTANSAAAIASGVYKIDLAQAEMNADIIVLRFTATGADDVVVVVKTDS